MALLVHCFQVELQFRVLVVVEVGKPGDQGKTVGARTRTNNKLNPHATPGTENEHRPLQREASALTTALSPWIDISYFKQKHTIEK